MVIEMKAIETALTLTKAYKFAIENYTFFEKIRAAKNLLPVVALIFFVEN